MGSAQDITLADVVRDRTWQAMLVVSLAALVLVYYHVFDWWWGEWFKEYSEYGHGPLIPIISAFAVYMNWGRISKTPVIPSLWGLAVLLPAIGAQFIGHRGGIPSIAGLTLPIALLGMTMLLFGRRVTWQLLFPIAFLYFMCVPPTSILNTFSFHLKMLSTTAAAHMLRLLNVNVVQDSAKLTMDGYLTIEVAGACSGIRVLIALLAFSAFLAYMLRGPLWGKLAMIAFVIPLSLAANVIRVTAIALSAVFKESTADVPTTDKIAGYVVLVVAIVVLVLFARLVKCRDFMSMPQS